MHLFIVALFSFSYSVLTSLLNVFPLPFCEEMLIK